MMMGAFGIRLPRGICGVEPEVGIVEEPIVVEVLFHRGPTAPALAQFHGVHVEGHEFITKFLSFKVS